MFTGKGQVALVPSDHFKIMGVLGNPDEFVFSLFHLLPGFFQMRLEEGTLMLQGAQVLPWLETHQGKQHGQAQGQDDGKEAESPSPL